VAVSGPRSTRTLVHGSPVWRIGVGVALAVIVGVGAGLYSMWRSRPLETVISSESQSVTDVPAGPAAPAVPDPAITSRLELAAASLEAHNYRAALAYARQVLTLDATHAEAAKIRDEASAVLARFDEAIADARRRVASGDVKGATQALNTARDIDPIAPGVADVASRLAELSRAPEPRTDARASRPPDVERQARGQTPTHGQSAAPALPQPPAAVTPQSQARGDVPSPPAASPPVPATPPPTSTAPATSGVIPPAPSPEPVAPSKPSPSSPAAETAKPREKPQASAPSPAEEDEAAIRQVTATYARAIEGKDLALFRSIKPNLSREEERRLQDGFRAVTSQRVDLTILSIDRRDNDASVVLRRRDTIQAGGRQQTTESRQTLTLARTSAGWKVIDIR
jgi:hypothetical protein